MVTVEPTRDYYADLELAPEASLADIKKAYRQAVLEKHPDRHPGEEAEYVPKFQAVQAAYEVLKDPGLRAKYDSQRLKGPSSRVTRDRPPRPNVPPRNRTTTEFPPPPRPPPPNSYKSSYSPPLNYSGPRKYARPTRANGHWGHYDSDEIKAKASDFKAWEQMRHGSGPHPRTRPPPPPRNDKNPATDPDRISPPRKEPETFTTKAREKWEDLLDAGMSKLGNKPPRPTSRKAGNGYDSYDEDELESRRSAYNVFKGDYPKKPEPPPLPKREARRGDPIMDPPLDNYAPTGARVRTNAAAPGMEKPRPVSANLHRANTSATARDPRSKPHRPDFDSVYLEGEHIRANSAGAASRSQTAKAAAPSSTTSEASSDMSSSENGDDDYVSAPPPTGRERLIPKSRKARMPAGGGGQTRPGFSPHVRVDEGQAPNARYTGSRRHSGVDAATGLPASDNAVPFDPNRVSQGTNFANIYPVNLSAEPVHGHHFPQRHRSFDGRYESPNGRYSPALPPRDAVASQNGYGSAYKARQDGRPPPPRSQSSETLKNKFSTDGSPPKFANTNPFAARVSSRQDSNGTRLPTESLPNDVIDPRHVDGGSPTSEIPPPPKVGDKWSPEEWEKVLGTHTFDVPDIAINNPPSARATSRKRSSTPKGSLNNLRRTGTFRAAAFQPTVIDDEVEPQDNDVGVASTIGDLNAVKQRNISDGSAMDIDSTPPAAHKQDPNDDLSPTSHAKQETFAMGKQSGSTFANGAGTSLNLNGFRHVAPFAPAEKGLGGISDLKDALPFDSRASMAKPDFATCYESMDLPHPPKPPPPPGGLDETSFAQYISAMNVYMYHWNNFNTKMVLMFQRRQEEHREIGQGWIGQVGGDVGAYLNALDEDERGRVWWTTACEKHKATMQNLQSVRDAMLKAKGSA